MPLSEESLAIRSTRVSASEVAAIVGQHPYMSAHQLWAKKTGLVPEKDLSGSYHIQRGIHLEPALVSWYRERTGYKVRYAGRHQRTHIHEERDLCCATPDGLIGSRGTLEAKASWYWAARQWGEPGTDLVPPHVHMQCMWQQAATGRTYTDCIGMTTEGDLGIWTVKFNPALFFSTYERVSKWWDDHVVANVAPPPDASDGCAETLLAQYPEPGSKKDMLEGPEFDAKALTLRGAHDALKKAELRYKAMSNEYKALLGSGYGAKTPSGSLLWYGCTGRRSTDWKGLARELWDRLRGEGELPEEIEDELINEHTKQAADYRVFKPSWSKENQND